MTIKNDKQENLAEKEKKLDRFIDDIISEKKPDVYNSLEFDAEDEQMFETVRALKRIRGKDKRSLFTARWVKSVIAVAAVLLLALGLSVMDFPVNQQAGIVNAFIRTYDELQGYTGSFEIRSEDADGDVDFVETVDISYSKPGKYNAVHRYDGLELSYISDGERVISYEVQRITLDNLFPEDRLWRYHIGTVADELSLADNVEVVGEDLLFGRVADVVEYSYSDTAEDESYKVWIDRETYLPLRKVLASSEGSLYVEFKELAINPSFEPDIFEVVIPDDKEVEELNRNVELAEITGFWSDGTRLAGKASEEMEVFQTGALKDSIYDYVIRFRDEEEGRFLDIYYTDSYNQIGFMPDSVVGRLGEGDVELNQGARNVFERYIAKANTARWVNGEEELFLVTNKEVSYLKDLLEFLAGEEVVFDDYE